MRSVHMWDGFLFYCVAFFWRANEDVLTEGQVSPLNTAAQAVLRSCLAEQALPVDLSVYEDCLHSGATAHGDAPRGIVAMDEQLTWFYIPYGHVFRLRQAIPGSGEAIIVYWLPGRMDGQQG